MKSFDICDGSKNEHVVIYPIGTDSIIEIPYDWGLAGRAGAWFTLRPPKGTPAEYVAEAKACLRRNRDVVEIHVEETK